MRCLCKHHHEEHLRMTGERPEVPLRVLEFLLRMTRRWHSGFELEGEGTPMDAAEWGCSECACPAYRPASLAAATTIADLI